MVKGEGQMRWNKSKGRMKGGDEGMKVEVQVGRNT